MAGLAPAGGGEGVAVHGVTGPDHRVPGGLDRGQQRAQALLDRVGAHAGDQGQAARHPLGVERLAQPEHLLGGGAGSELAAEGVGHPGEEAHVGTVEVPGALADPQQVGRAVVPVAGEAVPAGQRLLVAQEQGLVARVEVDLVQLVLGGQVDPAGGHEAQGPLDAVGDDLVALALPARRHELLVPGVHLVEVGEAPLGEGPQEVEGGRGLVVGGEQAGGIGHPGLGRRGDVVDHVAPERGQVELAHPLGRGAAGLGELAGDAAHLDHRHPGAVGEDDGHLQDEPQLVADDVGREGLEGLGAVAGLEEEGLSVGHRGQAGGQGPCLAGEHQRGIGGELLEHELEGGHVGPLGLLGSHQLAPRQGRPGQRRHAHHSRNLGPVAAFPFSPSGRGLRR